MGAVVTPELDFHIKDWLAPSAGDPLESETLASLQITASSDGITVTEVDDTLAHTVRGHINVPAFLVARWLLLNWWRLRWEPPRRTPSHDWLRCHSMSAIGGGYAWPAISFSSDGEFVQLRLDSEQSADVAAVRYLRDLTLDIPAAHFEAAVDRFLDEVEARISVRVPGDRALSELREELQGERDSAAISVDCKLQALAGIDPGAASEQWHADVRALVGRAGSGAAEEILAVTPMLEGGLAAADATISAMRDSNVRVRLDWAAATQHPAHPSEIPWVRATRLARELRARVGIAPGPISNRILEQLIDARLPFLRSAWAGRQLSGGYRNGARDGRTALLVTRSRPDAQRFYLARLIAAACVFAREEHVLPVSDADTAFQKFERSFAQEFLCPWTELDAFCSEHGTDEDGVMEAAEYFEVSELVVLSTLVNKRKVPRSRLQA